MRTAKTKTIPKKRNTKSVAQLRPKTIPLKVGAGCMIHKKTKTQKGGADQYGRDEPAKELGDKAWAIVDEAINHTPNVQPLPQAWQDRINDYIHRGAWDFITDEIRPQMGNSVSQFFSHIPFIGGPLANISNMF